MSKLVNKNVRCCLCVRLGQHMWVRRPHKMINIYMIFQVNMNSPSKYHNNKYQQMYSEELSFNVLFL